MNDLISRAALLNDLSYCAPGLWQDEEYIKAKIMKQHAVDAIPVEWLEKKLHEGYHRACTKAVLDMWQKEQEVR